MTNESKVIWCQNVHPNLQVTFFLVYLPQSEILCFESVGFSFNFRVSDLFSWEWKSQLIAFTFWDVFSPPDRPRRQPQSGNVSYGLGGRRVLTVRPMYAVCD